MFEKRLRAFSYAVGMTFIVIALLNLFNFIVYSMMIECVLDFWPFTILTPAEMIEYMLEIKLMGVFIGAVFLVSYFWGKRLSKTQ
ncbi:MAG: hypothetical protein V3W18_07195 [candidate division Zixibacteria bacterium]